MADPLQQPTAGALFAHELDIESLGLQRPSNPFEIGRGVYVEVRGQKSTRQRRVNVKLSQVGGRLLGRTWYNTIYGGAPNRL